MIDASFFLLLVVLWPLLLAVGIVMQLTHKVALKLVRFATLPAFLIGLLFSDQQLALSGLFIRSHLLLDQTGRLFLLMIAILWLATELLMQHRTARVRSKQQTIFQLLAMAGCFTMPLAGDVLLFLTASAVAGYSLYGLLAQERNKTTVDATNVFLILLVVSDGVLFELFQILGAQATSVDFVAMRQAFAVSEQFNTLFLMVLFSMGAKIGLLGLHVWLIPVFVTSRLALRPALIGFMFTAGFVLVLRLLPIGEVDYPAGAHFLQWGAWLTLGYALVLGFRQFHRRGVAATLLMLSNGAWLAILGLALTTTNDWLPVYPHGVLA
ncbi:MAG: proton-conducting transporter membrane subunit, partial [Sedimenticola sp.]|nr:proton-conducting transporter membrane subunit [Sedimenticola sp.]